MEEKSLGESSGYPGNVSFVSLENFHLQCLYYTFRESEYGLPEERSGAKITIMCCVSKVSYFCPVKWSIYLVFKNFMILF